MSADAKRHDGAPDPQHAPLDEGSFYPPLAVAADPRRTRARFWPKFWRVLGSIPFADDIAAAYYCAVDDQTPSRVKAVLMAALAYFVMPVDLIPDMLVAVGFTDDATVLATALGVVGAHIKPRHRERARERLGKAAQA